MVGALAFVVHLVLRSLITTSGEPAAYALQEAWLLTHALGLLGAVLVLLGLPAMYARTSGTSGLLGLLGVALVAIAWLFFGVFLSLYGMLIMPWLAESAPAVVSASAPLATGVLVAFAVSLIAWVAGTVLLGIQLLRRHTAPPWIGYLILLSGIWMVLGNLVIAPSGPATHLVLNLLSNLGPVPLLTALGYLGVRMWSDAELLASPRSGSSPAHAAAHGPAS